MTAPIKKGKAQRLAAQTATPATNVAQTYFVYRDLPLRGTPYVAGDTVELKPKQAAMLVAMGFIGTQPQPSKPSAEPPSEPLNTASTKTTAKTTTKTSVKPS